MVDEEVKRNREKGGREHGSCTLIKSAAKEVAN